MGKSICTEKYSKPHTDNDTMKPASDMSYDIIWYDYTYRHAYCNGGFFCIVFAIQL